MKRVFTRSFVLVSFMIAVTFIIIVGISIVIKNNANGIIDINDNVAILGFAAIILLILSLNITDIISYWISGKSQEIRVKNIVGVPKRRIYFQLFLNLNILLLLSFIIGILLSVVIIFILSFVSPYFIVSISAFSVIFSFVFNALILNGFCALLLKHKSRDGFMESK